MKEQTQRIVAWHPVLTDHQAYTYQELSRQSGLDVHVQVLKLEDEVRREQGWTESRVVGIKRNLIPNIAFLLYGFKYILANKKQIHIFGSPFANWKLMIILWLASFCRVKFFIISEPYSQVPFGYLNNDSLIFGKLKSFLRPILYKIYIRLFCKRISGLFAISRKAIDQYRNSGLSAEKIFPFGYFIPLEKNKENTTSANQTETDISLKIIFIGSLIKIKGIPILLSSVDLAAKSGALVTLDVYGPGDASQFDFGSNNVRYLGSIPFGKAQEYLRGYDLLVLPSYYDGWGVVVNESLCANVPVVCSDQVGAHTLVEFFGAGQVFASGDVNELAEILILLGKQPERLHMMKLACSSAADAIQPSKAAAYMLNVILTEPAKRTSIPSPWYKPK